MARSDKRARPRTAAVATSSAPGAARLARSAGDTAAAVAGNSGEPETESAGQFPWKAREFQGGVQGEFGELDLGANGEFDATIIETAFHDSVEDAAIMRDPKGREQIARSVYEGTLEYFDNWGNLNAPVVQPD